MIFISSEIETRGFTPQAAAIPKPPYLRWSFRALATSRLFSIPSVRLLLLATALSTMSYSANATVPDLKGKPAEQISQKEAELAEHLSQRVTIYRDSFGVPHIDAVDLPASVFAFAYCQCEDYFWQVEDTLVWSLGRYAELYGQAGLDSDLITHAFEIPSRSQQDAEAFEDGRLEIAQAFAAGINFYLSSHPETKPRLIERFEPWHLLAIGRRIYLELALHSNHISGQYMSEKRSDIFQQIGSNAWAVGPSRTKDGSTMLFINPHQPWYGYGQWYEAHVRTEDGIDFYGATFFGSPILSIGHNRHCGWSFTVNEPDIVDQWNVRFEADQPNHYRHGDVIREAVQWEQAIKIKGQPERQVAFRKTHHGPILQQNKDGSFQACQCARLYDHDLLAQMNKMLRAETVHDIREGMGMLGLPIFNTVAADSQGNILYLYSGAVPRRDPSFDWSRPVDGNDPRTDWHGFHSVDELPQIINPPTDYIQSCNSTPFTTTDIGNPSRLDFPAYMVMDQHDDKRRAQISRHLLRNTRDLSLEDFEELSFNTQIYWAMNELPGLQRAFARIEVGNPELADRARAYFEHFNDWDCTITATCTRSPLCAAWYEELYGFGYPAETLKKEFVQNPDLRFEALVTAAAKLQKNHGDWKVQWSEVYRLQRHHNVANLTAVPFSDRKPSIPCLGAPGPMGVVFTIYYTPSMFIPIIRETRKQYALVGTSYAGVVEFKKDEVKSRSIHNFGSSSDPESPHYSDQAELLAEKKMKDTRFDWTEIRSEAALRTYRPGEGVAAVPNR